MKKSSDTYLVLLVHASSSLAPLHHAPGTGPNENYGNKLFRDVLRKHKDAYSIAKSKEKRDIIARAIKEFKALGGRFIERVVFPSKNESSGKPCFRIVDGPTVSLKARQAFRYLLHQSVRRRMGHNAPPADNTATCNKSQTTTPSPRSEAKQSNRKVPTNDLPLQEARSRLPPPSYSSTSIAACHPLQVSATRSGVVSSHLLDQGGAFNSTSRDHTSSKSMDIKDLASQECCNHAPPRPVSSLGITNKNAKRRHEQERILPPSVLLPLRKNIEILMGRHGEYPTLFSSSLCALQAKLAFDSVLENETIKQLSSSTDSLVS